MTSEPQPEGAVLEAGVDLQCTSQREHFRAQMSSANSNPVVKRFSEDQTNRPEIVVFMGSAIFSGDYNFLEREEF